MIRCYINNLEVDKDLIRSNSTAFGKPLAPEYSIPFRIEIDIEEAAQKFGTYYNDFIARESEDEGFEEVLSGYYLSLKQTGYLSFKEISEQHPDLLAEILLTELPAEFLGYIFFDNNAPAESKKYVLQHLINVAIKNRNIICDGQAFLNPRHIE